MLRKIGTLMLVLILMAGIFTGCAPKAPNNEPAQDPGKNEGAQENIESVYPLAVEDAFGYKTTIEKQPTRIISIAPSHTEILFALELEDSIVGVSAYDDYPEEAKSKASVGDAFAVNIEKVIELEPDVVFFYGPGSEDTNKALRDAGIKLLCYEPETIDEVIALINEIGKITGKADVAKEITDGMIAKKEEILNKVSGAEKVKVFYEVWHEPLMTAGPNSFLGELITLSGGENIANDAQGDYAEFDLEQMIERNPDVYITAKDSEDKTPESIKARLGYDVINAIRNDRVYALEPNIISRPGPRIVDGLELMAKAIHPELFKE